MNFISRLAACALAALFPALAAGEDLTIVSKVTGAGEAGTTTQYITAGKFRVAGAGSDVIMDATAGRYTVIDNKKKEYYEFTADEMRAFFASLEQQMAGPMGAMMEKMMGGKPGAVTVTKGASRTVAGHACDVYTVSMGDNMRQEVCAAPSLEVPTQFYDAYAAGYTMLGPAARRFEKFFSEMKKIKGMPIATTTNFRMMGMNTSNTTEATEIRKGPIAATVFAVPAGYKKKDSPFKQRG
jgi:hypothetical protein